ncbi:MAG: hypothetical protein WD579_01400 [Candidatus Paceibacterota bacterium]
MKKTRLDRRIKLSNAILSIIAQIDEFKEKWSGSVDPNSRILGQGFATRYRLK